MTAPIHNWKRPKLPDANQGWGLPISLIVLFLGFVFSLLAINQSYADPPLAFPFMLMGFGATGVTITMILREIRRVAFEAALRAGEVQTVKPLA